MCILITVASEMSPHNSAIDEPFQFCGRPVESVGMERPLRVEDVEIATTIIVSSNSLSEVIVLSFAGAPFFVAKVIAGHFEIDLVEDVAHLFDTY